jgi:hypothetical protein
MLGRARVVGGSSKLVGRLIVWGVMEWMVDFFSLIRPFLGSGLVPGCRRVRVSRPQSKSKSRARARAEQEQEQRASRGRADRRARAERRGRADRRARARAKGALYCCGPARPENRSSLVIVTDFRGGGAREGSKVACSPGCLPVLPKARK